MNTLTINDALDINEPSVRTAMPIVPFGPVTTVQGATMMWEFLVGGSVGVTDAMSTAQQAAKAKNPIETFSLSSAVAANIAGFGASSTSMFQKLGSNSSQAGELAAKAAKGSAFLALAASTGSIYATVTLPPEQGGGFSKVDNGKFAALGSGALAVGAFFAPEAAVILGALAIGLTGYSLISPTASNTDVAAFLTNVKGVVQDYYHQLSASDQASFSTSMKGAMQSTLEGGFLVPKLNADGLIMGYGVERVLSTFNYPDGSTFYTFADGSSLVRNSLSTGESLESASAGRHDVWKLWNPTQPNSRVVIYGDGTYSNKFWDAEGHLVTQTNITGSNGTFKINADSSDGRYSLITVTGERNSIAAGWNTDVHLTDDYNTLASDHWNNIIVDHMATIYGVVQHVIGRSGAVIEMYGNATFDFVSNSGSMAIIRGVSRTAVVNGRGNMIKFYCDYGTIESSGNRILMNKGAGLTLHGIDNEINPSAQSRVSIWETGNHVNFNSSDSLVQIETENLKTFFHGSGGNIEFRKTGQEIESSGNNIKNWLSGYSQKITGDGNIIVPNWRSETILHGNNNTIDATGRPSHLFVSLKLTAPNSSVTVKGDGITIDALASGQNISLHGNGDWVTSNGNTLNMLADGLLVNVTGDANTINARGSSATNLHGNRQYRQSPKQ